MPSSPYFTRRTFTFLKDLAAHNDRDWFQANKGRYEDHVKVPALRFIEDFAPRLAKISPHFQAGPRSLFRIHRDVRFSNDKSPYKTATGIQFRHDRGKDAHAPGFYFHIEPGHVFVAAGMWHPDGPSLRKVRERIVEEPAAWKKAVRGKAFSGTFTREGDRLKRPPRGFDPEHPLLDDLLFKDHIAVRNETQAFVLAPDLPARLARHYRAAASYMRFLCAAVDAPF